MVKFAMLPFEILNMVMLLVATSPEGATTLARVRATCKLLKYHVAQANVLRAVNFQCLTSIDMLALHRNQYHLICMCARAGNEVAEAFLGKAVLNKDMWLWNMILGNGPRVVVVDENGSISRGPLQHLRLVRSFIRHGYAEDIVEMFDKLHYYLISFAGYEAYRAHGMFGAISNMCTYESRRLAIISSITRATQDIRATVMRSQIRTVANVHIMIPPHNVGPRDQVLVIFDKLFPSTPV